MKTVTTERRLLPRQRSFLSGRIAFDARSSTMDCLVRNLTPAGAKLVLSAAVPLPEVFELTITGKDAPARARLVWRREDEVGVTFEEATQDAVVSLDQVRRLRECQRECDALRARVADLTTLD